MKRTTKPIYLLADSQLLFKNNPEGQPFFHFLPSLLLTDARPGTRESLQAAYIGASNGDNPVFYELFEQAMLRIGITRSYMISSAFTEDDKNVLKQAEIILLAGGDTMAGWHLMKQSDIPALLLDRYNDGAVLMGVSAGAIQLGWQTYEKEADGSIKFADGLKLAPFLLSAHEEQPEWPLLQAVVKECQSMSRGIGLPYGGGIAYHPDGEAEVLGHYATEVIFKENDLHISLLS